MWSSPALLLALVFLVFPCVCSSGVFEGLLLFLRGGDVVAAVGGVVAAVVGVRVDCRLESALEQLLGFSSRDGLGLQLVTWGYFFAAAGFGAAADFLPSGRFGDGWLRQSRVL